jgi:hypothetical protein
LTSDRRDLVIVVPETAGPKAVAGQTVRRAMVADPTVVAPKDAADVGGTMVLVIADRKVDVVVRRGVAKKGVDRVGPMDLRDRRIRSGSLIALMRMKTAR